MDAIEEGGRVKRHFVEFQCPGTLVEERSLREIECWDVDTALEMARDIRVRHGQRPHSFRFVTRERDEDALDSTETARSARHFIGGVVETLEEIEARARPEERVLRANMRGNGWGRVVTTTSGGSKWTQPFGEEDVVVTPKEAPACA